MPVNARHDRRRPGRRHLGRWLVGAVAVAAALLAWTGLGGGHEGGPARVPPASRGVSPPPSHRVVALARPLSLELAPHRRGRLTTPVQDAAIAALDGSKALLLGGLSAADLSTDTIRLEGVTGERTLGRLPGALHDSAAVRLGRAVYLFGGGNGTAQLDQILRIDAAGRATRRGPAARAELGPGRRGDRRHRVHRRRIHRQQLARHDRRMATGPEARVVAHLPSPLRYAAVTAVGDRLVIAGGSLPERDGKPRGARVTPRHGRVAQIGPLPAPTTHAAAAASAASRT